MTDWELTRDGSTVEDSLFDVEVTDTANPFGDFAVCKIDDSGGVKFDQYERGTRIDLEVTPSLRTLGNTVFPFEFPATFADVSNGTVERFTGYVVERRELDQQGADVLEIEAYSFDQFLRNNTVSTDLTGKSLTEGLKSIIQNDTPVSYVPGNVDVGDSQELTRSYRGEPVERVLLDLAFKSQNEEFGVNDSLEFFFRPRETQHIDRGVDDTTVFKYDIPELSKEARNEVEVWYNDGNESVLVDAPQDKLDLQDALGLPEAGTQRAEIQRPSITDLSDAEDQGKQYLNLRNATLTGTVTTFGLFNAEPGDTINVQISARGIDTEFTIAAVSYNWGRDRTELTIVERKGNDNSEVIVRLTEAVQRVEMQGADRDAPRNRITTTESTALLEPTVTVDGVEADDVRVTNTLRNLLRDGFTGDGNITVSSIVVGDDPSGLSRSNTSLVSRTNSGSVTESLPDAVTVSYDSSVSQTGVQEVGLEDSNGNLLVRGIYNSALATNSSVSVTISVADDSGARSVVTTDGQTCVRDIIADNNPTLPDTYAYGSGSTSPTESDTSLATQETSVSLTEVLIQDASDNSEWGGILPSFSATDPLTNPSGGALDQLQTCYTQEAENGTLDGTTLFDAPRFSGNAGTQTTQGQAVEFDTSGERLEVMFTPQIDIPQSDFSLYIRTEATNSPEITITLNGSTWVAFPDGGGIGSQTNSPQWNDWATSFAGTGESYDGGGFTAGTTYTIAIESTTSGGSSAAHFFDVVAPQDNRFTYTFDDSVSDGTDGGRYLTGPELFPVDQTVSFATATTRRDVTEANFTLTANDTSNNFYVELANDGSTFNRVNNSDSGSVTFASSDTDVDTNVNIGRFGSRDNTTPTTGFDAQTIDDWNLFANPDAVLPEDIGEVLSRGIVQPGTLTGTTIQEAGLLSGSTLLTRHVFAPFTVQSSDTTVISAEITNFTQD